MSTVGTGTGTRPRRAAGEGPRTRPGARLSALARAELTLLGRSKVMIYSGLFAPLLVTFGTKATLQRQLELAGTGLSIGTVLLPAAIGMALLFAVYSNLVGVYVVRREERVLKRLRTGEVTDWEILVGTAVPAMLIFLAQCALYALGGSLALGVEPPRAPHLLLMGVLIGVVMMVALAVASAGVTRTAEAAQLTPFPFLMVSLVASGMLVPLEILPHRLAQVLELLPLSPVMGLVRDGWTGGADAGETVKQLVIGVVWAGLAVFAGKRWFRWEPRR